MTDCLFCKIASGEVPSFKIYEDDVVYAFLDINPVNLGHALVIPKKHHKNLYDLPDETLSHMARETKKLAAAIKEAVSADGINIMMNNDPAAGQIIFHAHVHIIPRFEGDGYKHWKGLELSEEKIKKSAEKIQSILS